MKTKYIVALIGAGGLIVATIITGIFLLINTNISKEKTTESQPVKIETSQPVVKQNDIIKEDVHSVFPTPKKPTPKSVFDHNLKAKNILDIIVVIPDKKIKNLLDNVFDELKKSLAEDNEYGETYYFLGVAFCKLGDYYTVINDFSNAIIAYNDSLYNFDKSEIYYTHKSNVYYDRGKLYTALGDIYSNNDLEKSKEYYQKAINDFNGALENFPYPENIYFAMANIHQKMKEYQKAIVSYTNALQTANDQYKPTKKEIFFERSNVNYELGLVNFRNKNYDIALQNYKDAIEDNSENSSAHYELGNTFCYLKRWKEAIHQYDLILEHGFRNIDLKMVKNSREFAISMIE